MNWTYILWDSRFSIFYRLFFFPSSCWGAGGLQFSLSFESNRFEIIFHSEYRFSKITNNSFANVIA